MTSSQFERVPPQNIDAEKSVLGGMLLVAPVCDEVAEFITAEDFFSDANRRIFTTIMDLHSAGTFIDPVTVAESLMQHDQLEEIGGMAYLGELLECVPHAAHSAHYAKIVREKSMRRAVLYGATEAIRKVYDEGNDIDEVLNDNEKGLHEIIERNLSTTASVDIKDILIEAMDSMGSAMARGIPSGFADLDEITYGFQPTLAVIGARPSVGKTAFALNLALNAARSGKGPVAFFSLEQSRLSLAERMLSCESKISGHTIRSGVIDEVERFTLMEASNAIGELPILVYDDCDQSAQMIASRCRLLKRRHGLSLAIIDYLQLIRPDDRRQPREQQVASISRALFVLARDLEVPVIVLAQLNREFDKRGGDKKKPRMSDLRESGAVEQDARLILLLDRPYTYDPEGHPEPGEVNLIVEKNSEGATGSVKLTYRLEINRFENAAPAHYDSFGSGDRFTDKSAGDDY